jgi:ribosomal-protein-alanine N-acetyltransferase
MDFILRPWQAEDLDSLVRFANNYEIAKFMNDHFPHPYTPEAGKAFIELATREVPHNILAIEVGGQAAGGIGIHPGWGIERKNAEMGYWLGQPFWGKGIISEAVKQMVEYAFKNWDINRIFARPFSTNAASQRVLQKAGFTLEARFEQTFFKNGEYFDEMVYAVRRGRQS